MLKLSPYGGRGKKGAYDNVDIIFGVHLLELIFEFM
jgi:hypothetical protein